MGRSQKLDVFVEKWSNFLATQRDNALAWIAVFLGFGSAIYFGLRFEPSYYLTGGIFCGCAALLFKVARLLRIYPEHAWLQSVWLLSCAFICMATGFALAQLETVYQGTPMVTSDTRPVKLSGVVTHMEWQEENKGTLAIIGDVKIDGWDAETTPHHVRLTIRKNIDAVVGDHVKMLAKLTPPSPPVMPGGYDFERHYYFEGIGALGFALSDVAVTKHNEGGGFFLTELRQKIAARIKASVPERQAGIVAALMTGERAAIYDDDWRALRVSGLAHIISISGLHVAMVAGPIFFIVRFVLALFPMLALNYPIKKYAAAAALLVACMYVGLVVPSVPTTRSLLMTGVMLIAVMLDRSPISLRIVALSALIVLVCQPDSVWSASFQMSFAAVAALVAAAEVSSPWLGRAYSNAGWIKRGALWVAGALLTSLVASIATAPFSLYHFGQVATYSVFANFVSIPLSGLIIMPMLMVSFLLMPLGLDGWSLKLMGQGVEWLLDVARYTEGLPHAQVNMATAPFSFLVAASLSGICLLFLRGQARWVFVGPAVYAMLSLWTVTSPIVLLSADGRVMAVREFQTLHVSSLSRNKFVTDSWRKHLGLARNDVSEFPREGADAGISCAAGLCRVDVGGQKIAYGDKLYELHQDCAWADIILTPARTARHFCGDVLRHVIVIDYYALKRGGAVAFYAGARLRMETVEGQRGKLPWSEHREYRAKRWQQRITKSVAADSENLDEN